MKGLLHLNFAIPIVLFFVPLVMLLGGCLNDSGSKRVEQYKDAAVSARNENAAIVGTMPDGFSNWAAKCDGPNMVYTIFHYNNNKETGGDTYGAITVVPNDPRCTKGNS